MKGKIQEKGFIIWGTSFYILNIILETPYR